MMGPKTWRCQMGRKFQFMGSTNGLNPVSRTAFANEPWSLLGMTPVRPSRERNLIDESVIGASRFHSWNSFAADSDFVKNITPVLYSTESSLMALMYRRAS